MVVGSGRDKRAALQPPFIVDRNPLSCRTKSPHCDALPVFRRLPRNNTNSCYSHGTLRRLRGSASSCRCNAGKGPLVSRIMLRCQPQWLAVDRHSYAIELVQSAFGNTAVSVRVRGRCSWASGHRANVGSGTNKVSRSRGPWRDAKGKSPTGNGRFVALKQWGKRLEAGGLVLVSGTDGE